VTTTPQWAIDLANRLSLAAGVTLTRTEKENVAREFVKAADPVRKLALKLAEAVIKTVPGPYKKGDPVPLVIRLADELKKALEGK